MIKYIKQVILLIEYIIIKIVFIISSILPINLVSQIGGYTFKTFGPFSKSHQTALLNYKKIFKNISNNELNNQVHKSWENLGKTFFELSILEKILDSNNHKIDIQGIENINRINKENKPVIFFGIHQSNWEILVPIIDRLGVNVGAIYRHINNKLIDKLIIKKRNQNINKLKSFYTPKGRKSAKDILNAISAKNSIILLVDQKDSAGEKTKLFNYNVKTQTGFLKIARKYNLKIIPIKNTRHNINNFTVTFYPPIMPYKKNKSDIDAMNEIHEIIENWILENPTQWFWQHNRFS